MRALVPAFALALLLILLGRTGASGRAYGAPEPKDDPFDCPIRAILLEDDAGLRHAYDGIRRGLEQAQLPRVCLETPDAEEDLAAILARLEAEPPPLVFVLGTRGVDALGDHLKTVPRVFVDTAWYVNGAPVPADPAPEGRAAVVRSVRNAARVAEILRELVGTRPAARLSWEATTPELEERAHDLAAAAGFRAPSDEPGGEPRFLLHLRMRAGEVLPLPSELAARAEREQWPLVSDDLGHWRRGAAVLVLPDHKLLGRIAADAGRRLLAEDAEAPPPRHVGLSEVRVDLTAARRQGLHLPAAFLAGVDVIRGSPVALPREASR